MPWADNHGLSRNQNMLLLLLLYLTVTQLMTSAVGIESTFRWKMKPEDDKTTSVEMNQESREQKLVPGHVWKIKPEDDKTTSVEMNQESQEQKFVPGQAEGTVSNSRRWLAGVRGKNVSQENSGGEISMNKNVIVNFSASYESRNHFLVDTSSTVPKKITRRRRALNFPSGTTLQFGVCYFPFVVGTHGLFNFGITMGSNWEVPDNVHKYKYPNAFQSRRDRRSLYPKIASLLSRLGLQGERWVLRGLCQLNSGRRHKKNGRLNKVSSPAEPSSFLFALLGALLHYPPSADLTEPHDQYDAATLTHDCEKIAQLF